MVDEVQFVLTKRKAVLAIFGLPTDRLPSHPGEILFHEFIEDGPKLTQAKLAEILECSQPYVSDLIHGRRGLSLKMCVNLAQAGFMSIRFWWNLQQNYRLAKKIEEAYPEPKDTAPGFPFGYIEADGTSVKDPE